MAEQNNTFTSVAAANEGALKMRLDTSKLLKDIELFLRGEIITVDRNDKGQVIEQRTPIGQKKANDEGIQDIMTKLSSIINPSVVQGNFTYEDYQEYIYNSHLEILEMIWVNLYRYDIDEHNIQIITNFCMSLIIPFMSRLIDNKERDSYANTIKTQETTREGGGRPWPFNNGAG